MTFVCFVPCSDLFCFSVWILVHIFSVDSVIYWVFSLDSDTGFLLIMVLCVFSVDSCVHFFSVISFINCSTHVFLCVFGPPILFSLWIFFYSLFFLCKFWYLLFFCCCFFSLWNLLNCFLCDFCYLLWTHDALFSV